MNPDLAILTAILAAAGDPMYEDRLLRELPQFTGARITLADLRTRLSSLELKGHLTATAGTREDDQGNPMPAYFLTPKGRNRAQAQ